MSTENVQYPWGASVEVRADNVVGVNIRERVATGELNSRHPGTKVCNS